MSSDAEAPALRVGIEGLGRLGRLVLRHALVRSGPRIDVVVVADPAAPEQLARVVRHDSVLGRCDDLRVDAPAAGLWVGSAFAALVRRTREPIRWSGVDVVVDCSPGPARRDDLDAHLRGGAPHVVRAGSAEADRTLAVGVEAEIDPAVRSIASGGAVIQAVAPLLGVLDRTFGVRWGLVTVVGPHADDQPRVDTPAEDPRRGRAAGSNIVPRGGAAARELGLVLPSLAGKIAAWTLGVPGSAGSMFELACTLGDGAGLERVLDVLRGAREDPGLRGILDVRAEPLVSSDVVGDLHSAIIDETACQASGPLLRLVGWFDADSAHAARLLDLAVACAWRTRGRA